MLEFKEIKLEKVCEPAKKHNDTESSLSVYCNKKIRDLLSLTLKCDNSSEDRISYIKNCNALLSSINTLYVQSKKIMMKNLEKTDSAAAASLLHVDATLEYINNEIVIKFNCLPTKRSSNLYDNTHFSAGEFHNAIFRAHEKYLKNNIEPIPRMASKKTLLTYVFHYSEKIKDFDNYNIYDLKIITDDVATLFLTNDSPYCVDQFLTSKKDSTDYLEIRLSDTI